MSYFTCNNSNCPCVSSKSNRNRKVSIHFAADYPTTETVFRIIFLPISLSLYGAVAKMCEEVETIKKDRDNLMYWWDNQLFSVKSRQKYLVIMRSDHTRIFYCSDMKNESNCFHKEKQSEWILYGCRIYTCCWDWTVFHDQRHWWTILCESLSWIHSCKKWRIITTKRLASGKHENWTRIGNHDQLSVRQTWNWNQNLVSEKR